MSYLSLVESQLEDVFFDAFDRAWMDVVEPALKQSDKNGLADGRAGKDPEDMGVGLRWNPTTHSRRTCSGGRR